MSAPKTKPRNMRLSDDHWERLETIRKFLEPNKFPFVGQVPSLADALRYAIDKTFESVTSK